MAVKNACTEESKICITIGKAVEDGSHASGKENDGHDAKLHRDVIGVATLSIFLAPWHMLPVFTDIKMAEDPLLPGLTSSTLPITTTAIFCGWLVGSIGLKRAMETFSSEELIVLANTGLLVVALCTVTLPYLTRGNLGIFLVVRFVYGVLMNVKPIQLMYVQDRAPPALFTQVLVFQYCMYTLIAVVMAGFCGSLTLSMNWTIEVALWCGLTRWLGLWLAFPNAFEILQQSLRLSGPVPDCRRPSAPTKCDDPSGETTLAPAARRSACMLIVCFIACGSGFYGLSFSAGQLSPNLYLSSVLLYTMDFMAYLGVTAGTSVGQKSMQLWSFLVASLCLFICSIGEPGSRFVLVFALIGRLGIDICFATNYLVLAETFSEAERVVVLPVCETAARLGSILAPFAGTLPTTEAPSYKEGEAVEYRSASAGWIPAKARPTREVVRVNGNGTYDLDCKQDVASSAPD
ncbi:unnamed protein product [Cladocopium goreaui]|uniref:Solute carrier family 22 member 21 (Organic cation/carnitine transporter 3) (Solute carrier family 22 member 9) n=1 Tax=Cladocopium goreaui TaxID=2562237 RepID=A0A9P1BXI8_9DINO|nr:unnamed protein product [Cladocopium goreaui]